jgi:DNA-directed RNA polymerase specialized sigma24 family protein
VTEFTLETLIVLSRMPPLDREFVIDHHVLDRSMKEIGASTGLSWQSVKERCRKGERRLRGEVGG